MKSLEAKVGALIVVSLVLLGGFLALLGNFSWRGGTRIRINYDFSGNLQSGAAVKISGIKVGKVEEVRYLGGQVDPDTGKRVQVRVVAFVEDRVKESIRKNAEFFINTQGVLGEQYLEIQPGSWDQPPLDPSHSVEGVNPPRTDLIVARLYEFLDSITGLLRDDKDVIKDFLQSGASVVRTLDDILKTNKAEIGRLLGNVDALSKQAAGLLASIQNGVGDAAQLKATIGNIESISQSIKRDIDPLLAKAKKALDGVDRVTSVVGPGERDKLQKALDELVVVGDKAEKLTSDAQSLISDIKKGKGTAGALLVDPQIYDDLKELVRDLKRNPWKFFWKE
ncbi:MAG TPA: MlaD family protein [Polyangia bacterium]|nr:MlaD family protein [Polyangia bacterium]